MGAGALKSRDDLANLLMAWYYAGYFTGQWSAQHAGDAGEDQQSEAGDEAGVSERKGAGAERSAARRE